MTAEPLIFELSSPGRTARNPWRWTCPPRRSAGGTGAPGFARLPEVSEIDVVRHYTRLSQTQLCRRQGHLSARLLHDEVQPQDQRGDGAPAGLRGPASLQPRTLPSRAPAADVRVAGSLKEIGGFAGVTLQPAAGAHGEFTGVLMMRNYHLDPGRDPARHDPGARLGPRHQPGDHEHERHCGSSSCPRTNAATSISTRCAAASATRSSA
jgi:glycine dehydrogenase subunit 2